MDLDSLNTKSWFVKAWNSGLLPLGLLRAFFGAGIIALAMIAEAGLDDAHGVLATTLVTLGRIAHEHPEIVEIDVNPMIIHTNGTIAVDALVVIDSNVGNKQ